MRRFFACVFLSAFAVSCTAGDARDEGVTVAAQVSAGAPFGQGGAHVIVQLSGFSVFKGHLGEGGSLLARDDGFHSTTAGLEVTLPREAPAATRIAAGDAWIEVRALDLDAVPGEAVDGAVVYRSARPETDVTWIAEPGQVEEIRLLHSTTAATVARYAIQLGPTLAKLRVREGRIEALDASGRMRLGTAPAFAVDAKGVRREVTPRLEDDGTVTLSFDATGLEAPIAVDPVWAATPSMSTSRERHATVALSSGKVLVAGGVSGAGEYLSTTEIYDPASNTWAAGGAMASRRAGATAILLSTGKVLIAGGRSAATTVVSTSEVYDPAANVWGSVSSMAGPRDGAASAPLGGTKVLLVGGTDGASALSTAEVFDAASSAWTSANAMAARRTAHTATELSTGKVLVAGGAEPLSNAEIYDVTTNAWTIAPFMKAARGGHTATRLPDGRVLVTGGGNVATSSGTNTAEIYDPAANTWTFVSSMPTSRTFHSATLLTTGKVLVAGGRYFSSSVTSSSEIFDPTTNTWSFQAYMATPRFGHTSARAGNGAIIIGGRSAAAGPVLETAEVFSPSATGATCKAPSDCASGFCVDGYCCDKACTGQCESCNQPGKLGVCSPHTGSPRPGKPSCAFNPNPSDACKNLQCNGVDGSKCNYVGATYSCGGLCNSSGQFQARGTCDGAGNCSTGPITSCAPYRCQSSTTGCYTSCTSSLQCVSGSTCTNGKCGPPAPTGTCSADGNSVVPAGGGTPVSCFPYKCSGSTCRSSCFSHSQCATGALCDTTRAQCVAGEPADSGGCFGCRVGKKEDPSGHLLPAGLLGVVAVVARGIARRRTRR